jgi:hypothetical protein
MTNKLNIKPGQLVKMKKGEYKGRIFEFTGKTFIEGSVEYYELQRTEGNAWKMYWKPTDFKVLSEVNNA